jgi:hypothetical protein
LNWENVGQTRRLPSQMRSVLEQTLEDGEQVIWFEQPDVRRWRSKGYSAVPFALGLLAIVWHAAPWKAGGWYWLIAFLLLPGLILLALPWSMHSSARSTLYVVTNRRALILTAARKAVLRSYPVQQLPELIMRPRADGSGELIFEIEHYEDSDGSRQTREYGFEDIREVGLVRQILENLKLGKDPELVRRHAALWRLA